MNRFVSAKGRCSWLLRRASLLALVSVGVALIASPNGWAQRKGSAPKIGVVDFQRVIEQSLQGKRAYADLKKIFDEKQRIIQLRRDALNKIRDELERQGPLLSASVRRAKEESFQKQGRGLRRLVSDSREDMRRKEGGTNIKLAREIMGVAKRIGKREGYTLLLEARDGIIYFDSVIDLTKQVVGEYDRFVTQKGRSAPKPSKSTRPKKK